MKNNNIYFNSNIIFLFNLNRQKNNLKKIHFSREMGVHNATVVGWTKESLNYLPSEINLERICMYFNKYLNLNISKHDLVYTDIKKSDVIKEPEIIYLTDGEKYVIIKYRGLDDRKKLLVNQLLTELRCEQ